jgi:hypothetical protein
VIFGALYFYWISSPFSVPSSSLQWPSVVSRGAFLWATIRFSRHFFREPRVKFVSWISNAIPDAEPAFRSLVSMVKGAKVVSAEGASRSAFNIFPKNEGIGPSAGHHFRKFFCVCHFFSSFGCFVIRKAYPVNKKLQRRKHVFPLLNCVLQLTKLSDSLASKSCFRCGKLRCHVDKKKGP